MDSQKQKHFALTNNFIVSDEGKLLYQIKCIEDTKHARIGELGGYIEHEDNLAGTAWIDKGVQVSGNSKIEDGVLVVGRSYIKDSIISGKSNISDSHINGSNIESSSIRNGSFIDNSKVNNSICSALSTNGCTIEKSTLSNQVLTNKKYIDNGLQAAGEIKIPSKIGNVEITPEQRAALQEGKHIILNGLKDKNGKEYKTVNVAFNKNTNKIKLLQSKPDKKITVANKIEVNKKKIGPKL
ncbi:MAG: DUF3945 domain-containing protein [Prevotellaceae bacterium]|jgi:hypothetical protein|nr:DUF3945 domain-containing protein [Prevotellaceae bacterium]